MAAGNPLQRTASHNTLTNALKKTAAALAKRAPNIDNVLFQASSGPDACEVYEKDEEFDFTSDEGKEMHRLYRREGVREICRAVKNNTVLLKLIAMEAKKEDDKEAVTLAEIWKHIKKPVASFANKKACSFMSRTLTQVTTLCREICKASQ